MMHFKSLTYNKLMQCIVQGCPYAGCRRTDVARKVLAQLDDTSDTLHCKAHLPLPKCSCYRAVET